MTKETIRNEDNTVLWHLVFRPFIPAEVKEEAREELRRRGQYGEPIIAEEA